MKLSFLVLLANVAISYGMDPQIPTEFPTLSPTIHPSVHPSVAPTFHPTMEPSLKPSVHPTVEPSLKPTVHPTVEPSLKPTVHPSVEPTVKPTVVPSVHPTVLPTTQPSVKPSVHPTVEPSVLPSVLPTIRPTVVPSVHPTVRPSVEPSISPTQPPTRHPTIAGPGWLLESYYYDSSDTSDPLVVYGTRTQTCLSMNSYFQVAVEDNTEYDGYWYKYSCGDDYVQFQIYSDSDCSNIIHMSQQSFDFDEDVPYIGYNTHFGSIYYQWRLQLNFVQLQCVDDGNQYTFTEGQNYAVIEYFPGDESATDELTQCNVDYTQFASYQRDICFTVNIFYDFNTFDYSFNEYFQFEANDDTFIALTRYYSDACEGSDDNDHYINNIFPIDTCEMNYYQVYSANAHKKETEEKRLVEKKKHSLNPFKFDSNTPTVMKHVMAKSFVEAQGKTYIPYALKMNTKIEEARKKNAFHNKKYPSASGKKAQGIWDDYDDAFHESGPAYFHDDDYVPGVDDVIPGRDDDYGSVYYNAFDDEYYNYFIPGIGGAQVLSEYYKWSNVPALSNASAPATWFSEILSYEGIPTLVSTRRTLTCMPYGKFDSIEFNYMVACSNGIMFFDAEDIACTGDYLLQSKNYYTFSDDGSTGKKEYWNLSPTYDCSNVMFSPDFIVSISDDERSYATEFFYSLKEDTIGCSSSNESTSDVTMGVAILEDWCFTITAYPGRYTDDDDQGFYNDDDIDMMYSAKYWVDQEDNNQNIQLTVWEAAQCNDKFITQTKEIEINMCYDYQPNTVYQSPLQPASRRLGSGQHKNAKNKLLASFEQHNSMSTPFNAELAAKAPKRKAHKKMHSAMKETADKDVEWFYDYYYHYADAGNTFFNNRYTGQLNQWFTLPTSATISPSEVPTMSPSQPPSRHPTVEPSVEPSQPPTVLPTIRPTLAPNPPTQRPTPALGMPTASPSHQVTYTFSVTQNLDGIDATTFNSDENNAIAFINALTMAMPPLVADNFAISDVSDEAGARRLRALTAEAVDIMYWVTYTVAETGYNDAETAYAALIASLNTSVVLDLFDGYIQVSAEDKDAPDLLPTTTSSFTASPATQVGTDDDSKPLTDNHHKVIVGVLVGLGGGLLLIAVIAWCIFGRGEDSGASQRHSNPQSLEMTFAEPTTNKSAI